MLTKPIHVKTIKLLKHNFFLRSKMSSGIHFCLVYIFYTSLNYWDFSANKAVQVVPFEHSSGTMSMCCVSTGAGFVVSERGKECGTWTYGHQASLLVVISALALWSVLTKEPCNSRLHPQEWGTFENLKTFIALRLICHGFVGTNI